MSFQKGQSGNIQGRPIGSLNKKTETLRLLLDGESEALIRKAVERAKEGDMQALKLCLERILPPLKDASLNVLCLPRLNKTASSILTFNKGVINKVIEGEITPLEGESLINMAEKYGRAIDSRSLEVRIMALEAAAKK